MVTAAIVDRLVFFLNPFVTDSFCLLFLSFLTGSILFPCVISHYCSYHNDLIVVWIINLLLINNF